MNRIGYGIEVEEEKIRYIKEKIIKKEELKENLFHGSSENVLSFIKENQIDFCITSPPYMNPFDQENPLTNKNGGNFLL